MIPVTLLLDPSVVQFYAQIARISDHALEQVLSDALFKLAGELSLQALQNKKDCNSSESLLY